MKLLLISWLFVRGILLLDASYWQPVVCRKTIVRDFGASCNIWTPQQTCPKALCRLGSFTLDLCRPKVLRHEGCLDHTDCYCLEAIPKTLTSTTASTTSPTLTTTYSTDLKTDSQWSTGKVFKTRSSNMHSSIPKTKELAHAGGFPEVLIVATTTAATLSTLMVNGSLTTFDNGTLTRHHAHLDVGSTSLTALWIVVILLVSVCFVVVVAFLAYTLFRRWELCRQQQSHPTGVDVESIPLQDMKTSDNQTQTLPRPPTNLPLIPSDEQNEVERPNSAPARSYDYLGMAFRPIRADSNLSIDYLTPRNISPTTSNNVAAQQDDAYENSEWLDNIPNRSGPSKPKQTKK